MADAEYLKDQRSGKEDRQPEEAQAAEPRFTTPDTNLSAGRLAARRFMRENPTLMGLLAK